MDTIKLRLTGTTFNESDDLCHGIMACLTTVTV